MSCHGWDGHPVNFRIVDGNMLLLHDIPSVAMLVIIMIMIVIIITNLIIYRDPVGGYPG